ncbi:aminoglycoside phosphotransferase family protein [Paenibacillus sp. FSL W8-0186]|uniref:phosphotransferase family protein n=1 Tax=Paenibacillus sp. FSL W8-0186 TaxID=2921709 RepID=UPI0030D05A2B
MPESQKLQRNEGLSESVLAWIRGQCGGSWNIRDVRPLLGGISSAVYELILEKGGESARWVLRQYTDRVWLEEEPDLVAHESAALQAASEYGIMSPKWIASDDDGSGGGMPSVLMSRLPGEVVLMPADRVDWLRGLAQALAQLHLQGTKTFPWTYFSYIDPTRFSIPEWTGKPDVWREIARIIQGPEPAYTPRFIHRDYHPGNVLWKHGRVSGIVDWVNACLGPSGIDVGHCRVNLAQLHGSEAADRFLAAYLECMQGGQAAEYDPYWDMVTLACYVSDGLEVYRGWIDLGITHLDEDVLAERLDKYAEGLLQGHSASFTAR